jgi:hypothetical protein
MYEAQLTCRQLTTLWTIGFSLSNGYAGRNPRDAMPLRAHVSSHAGLSTTMTYSARRSWTREKQLAATKSDTWWLEQSTER